MQNKYDELSSDMTCLEAISGVKETAPTALDIEYHNFTLRSFIREVSKTFSFLSELHILSTDISIIINIFDKDAIYQLLYSNKLIITNLAKEIFFVVETFSKLGFLSISNQFFFHFSCKVPC